MPVALIAAAGMAADSTASRAAAVEWASAHATALSTCQRELQADDLHAFGDIIGSARVVGFGEGAHGAHEFLILRNRILEYLVEEHGFTAIIAETHPVHAEPADAYAQGRSESSADAMEGVFAANRTFFWRRHPFQENFELLEWMRAYNSRASSARPVRFYGMDLRHPFPGTSAVSPGQHDTRGMAGRIIDILDRLDPGERVMVFAHNAHLRGDSLAGAGSAEATPGQRLRQALGDQYRVIGSVHDKGALQDGGNRTAELPASRTDSVSQVLAEVGQPCFVLDLRMQASDSHGRAWFDREQAFRGSHWLGTSHYFEARPSAAYDALVFVGRIRPVEPFLAPAPD